MAEQTLAALTVQEAAETRRSIRRYTHDPVPREDLEEILRLVGLAPSAWNIQPWRFVVVQDPEVKQKLSEAAHGQRQVSSAPVVLVLYSDMRDALANLDEVVHSGVPAERRERTIQGIRAAFASKSEAEREAWGAGQSYIALGYLLLLARSTGYDTSAMLGFELEKVKRLLGLPTHVAIPAIVAMGVADEEGLPHHRHSVERIAMFR